MTGIVGVGPDGPSLSALLAPVHQEPWYETDRAEAGDYGLAIVHHGTKDPGGWHCWQDGRRAGVIHGAITNLDAFDGRYERLFARVFEAPAETLRRLDGPFLLAAVDDRAERLLVATDKLGARPCYYATEDGFAFGSNAASPLAGVENPTVDVQGVSDMVMLGQVWGEKTLVEEVSTLPPATVLESQEGSVSTEAYWQLDVDVSPKKDPFTPIVNAYRRAMADTSATMDGSVGLWLSGGLDSRTMASELSRNLSSLVTYTYDANPAGGGNIEIAKRIAERVGAENELVPLTPDRFVDVFETAVSLTGGMLTWRTFLNLTAVFNIDEPTDLILEGCGQGTLMGAGIGQTLLGQHEMPEEVLYHAKHQTDRATVQSVLAPDVDPMATYRTVVADAPSTDPAETALTAYYRNYVARGEFASNRIARSQVGSRVPLVDGEFLTAATDLPLSYRERAIPFTGGKIPAGAAKGKFEFTRALDDGLSDIPYERTKFPPSYPHWLHTVGFVADTGSKRLLGKTAYGGRRMQSRWYESNDRLRALVDGLLDDAATRPVFDADTLQTLRRAHGAGEANNLGPLAAVSTVESWLQQHLE